MSSPAPWPLNQPANLQTPQTRTSLQSSLPTHCRASHTKKARGETLTRCKMPKTRLRRRWLPAFSHEALHSRQGLQVMPQGSLRFGCVHHLHQLGSNHKLANGSHFFATLEKLLPQRLLLNSVGICIRHSHRSPLSFWYIGTVSSCEPRACRDVPDLHEVSASLQLCSAPEVATGQAQWDTQLIHHCCL